MTASKSPPLTRKQKLALLAVVIRGDDWTRAQDHGARVTFASMYYRGWFERRAWRGEAGEANAAYEYRGTESVRAAWAEVDAKVRDEQAKRRAELDGKP